MLAAAVNIKLDIMDFYISQLEVKEAVMKAEVTSVYFFPKSHCELNPIEMLWGFMKYSKSLFID